MTFTYTDVSFGSGSPPTPDEFTGQRMPQREQDAQDPVINLQHSELRCPGSTLELQTDSREPENLSDTTVGGYGWVCVATCFTINCFSWGVVSVSIRILLDVPIH